MEAEVAVVPGAGSSCSGCAITTVTAAFLQPTTLNIGLDFHAMLGPHRCGAQLDQRHRIGVLAPHALDLIGKIDHAVDDRHRSRSRR